MPDYLTSLQPNCRKSINYNSHRFFISCSTFNVFSPHMKPCNIILCITVRLYWTFWAQNSVAIGIWFWLRFFWFPHIMHIFWYHFLFNLSKIVYYFGLESTKCGIPLCINSLCHATNTNTLLFDILCFKITVSACYILRGFYFNFVYFLFSFVSLWSMNLSPNFWIVTSASIATVRHKVHNNVCLMCVNLTL